MFWDGSLKIVDYNSKRGIIKLIPHDQDDLWVIYNIVQKGDTIHARSRREIKVISDGARPVKGKRVSIFLGMKIEKAIFQRQNEKLRIHGIIIDAPEKYEIKGFHHTISVQIGKPITISKDKWFRYDLNMIKRAGKWKTIPILIIAIDDEESSLAILRQNSLQILDEIKGKLPRKREVKKREAAKNNYFKEVLNSLARKWNENQVLVAIVGPGFFKNSFANFLKEKRSDIAKTVSVVGFTTSGGIGGVKESLRSGVLDKVTKKVRYAEETKAVEDVLYQLGSGKRTVSYGLPHVYKAVNYGAVKSLLVSIKLLREADDEKRRFLEDLMRKVEKMGGRIMLVSSDHEAGTKLLSLGGIVANLRYNIEIA